MAGQGASLRFCRSGTLIMTCSSVTFWTQSRRTIWRVWNIPSSRSPRKPDTRILRYEHRNVKVEIAPSVRGLATIYDKDILIYCISQLMAKKNAGEPLAQTLHLNAHELLVWTNRETSGDAYRRLKESFERPAHESRQT
jgi:plasmid replication initiation protein